MTLKELANIIGEFNLATLYSEGVCLGTDWLRIFCRSDVLANSKFEKMLWSETNKAFEIHII